MSHSSGIPVSSSLTSTFIAALQSSNVRMIKVQIVDDELTNVDTRDIGGSWMDDLDSVSHYLDEKTPCFILYRTDVQGPQGLEWILLCYVPDKCKVKDKMVYASSRGGLRRALGSSYFVDEVFGSIAKDLNQEGYKLHRHTKEAAPPLTNEEYDRKMEREQEGSSQYYHGVAGTAIHGVAFPFSGDMKGALADLASSRINYLQLKIDPDAEQICVSEKASIEIEDLGSKLPDREPRFHIFSYKHEFEGEELNSLVYIFSCPDGSGGTQSSPVRLRMLYSSSKQNVENFLTGNGLALALKMEVNTPKEVQADVIDNSLHPPAAEQKEKFSKPSRPGKGNRRLIK